MPAIDVLKGVAIVGAALLISANLGARTNRWTGGRPVVESGGQPAAELAPRRADPWHDTALGIFR